MQLLAELCVSSAPRPEAAWEELISRFGPGLKKRVGRVLRRAGMRPRGEQVEELLQEVYCRLLAGGGRRIQNCRATSEPQVAAFLGRVAERVVLDQLRAARAQKRGRDQAASGGAGTCAIDPRANPEEQVLGDERVRLFLERCGTLAGRRDYRRNARILAMAVSGWSSAEIARTLGGALSARGVEGLLSRVRRDVADHARAAAASLDEPPPLPRRVGGMEGLPVACAP
jgi:DNA-directed RNA polymerase specialized sigma24 family protein